ncbi:atlastin-like [Contarinia nasturtii]|uniref:atlastin-like n=1 Tax=Contarinia nasturtii TaxID=265458 RepID=UPI0012D38B27|nr:atlastin-like [Contarinia nasturtii]
MNNSIEFDDDTITGFPIQIVLPNQIDETFQFEKKPLEQLLNSDDIKDHQIVVVSIAGALRMGKSFLLNFFLKYLYAKYKRNNVEDWIGENKDCDQFGFKWRGGQNPETNGLWIWSEIFTHENNGVKIAIILLDTQGIFDDTSGMKTCTTIFALSTLISSVQCYNIMRSIKEDDLQHLELFTEYGRLLLESSDETPFQKLIFIVRDWPYACETDFGWNNEVIDKKLANSRERTAEMNSLRKRIRSNFDEIKAFLLPYPGGEVAESDKFDGSLQQIKKNFITNVKELVPDILAPKNLVVKKINGQPIRAGKLVHLLETYINVFNSNKLPEPRTVYMATVAYTNTELCRDCMAFYENAIQKQIKEWSTFIEVTKLDEFHKDAKSNALKMFDGAMKMGDRNTVSYFKDTLKEEIKKRFKEIKYENELKRENNVNSLRKVTAGAAFGAVAVGIAVFGMAAVLPFAGLAIL